MTVGRVPRKQVTSNVRGGLTGLASYLPQELLDLGVPSRGCVQFLGKPAGG